MFVLWFTNIMGSDNSISLFGKYSEDDFIPPTNSDVSEDDVGCSFWLR